jgi:uncharacterized membrane protein
MFRSSFRVLFALSFVAVGTSHFMTPEPFVSIMPAYLPWHLELVYISGLFEVLGGIGLIFPITRRVAAWGLIALLIAVYPANINMLMNDIYIGDMPRERWLLWARMPLQLLMALGVMWGGEIGPFSSSNAPSSPPSSHSPSSHP